MSDRGTWTRERRINAIQKVIYSQATFVWHAKTDMGMESASDITYGLESAHDLMQ